MRYLSSHQLIHFWRAIGSATVINFVFDKNPPFNHPSISFHNHSRVECYIHVLHLLVAAVSFLPFTAESRGCIMTGLCQPALTISIIVPTCGFEIAKERRST